MVPKNKSSSKSGPKYATAMRTLWGGAPTCIQIWSFITLDKGNGLLRKHDRRERFTLGMPAPPSDAILSILLSHVITLPTTVSRGTSQLSFASIFP